MAAPAGWTEESLDHPGPRQSTRTAASDSSRSIPAGWTEESLDGKAKNAPEQPGFLNTLGREVGSAWDTIKGTPPAIYHAFADPATSEEKQENAQFEKEHGEAPGTETSGLKRVGLGIGRIAVDPQKHAADWYKNAIQGKIPNPVDQALSVLPEAIGSGAGSAILGKAMDTGVDVAKNPTAATIKSAVVGDAIPRAASTIGNAGKSIVNNDTVGKVAGAPVRAASTIANKALTPRTIGTAAGAHFGPVGALVGGELGAQFGTEPMMKIPGQNFGLKPKPIYPGAPLPDDPGTFPGANLPDAPATELLKARSLLRAGESTPPNQAEGLGKIPVKTKPAASSIGASDEQVGPIGAAENQAPAASLIGKRSSAAEPGASSASGDITQGVKPEPAAATIKPSVAKIADQVQESLGGKKLAPMPNVPLRDQLPAMNRNGAPPPGVASVEPEHMGQFARANGLDLHKAIPETESGDVLRAKIHDLSNVEVRQLAINSGEDMGQLRVGSRKGTDDVPRQTVLSRILTHHSPEQIGQMIDRGEHLQAARSVPSAEEVEAGTADTRRSLQHSSKKEVSEIGKERGIDLTGGHDPKGTGAVGGKLRAVESIIDDMSSGELTGRRSAPAESEGELSTAPVDAVLQRISGARTTLQGKTQVQEHTNPAMLHDLAKKFRDAGGWPKDVQPIEIRLDAKGNVIEANGRHRVSVARAVLGPDARIPVKVIRTQN